MYLTSMGGGHSFLFWGAVVVFLLMCELLGVVETWWLGYWARQYTLMDPRDVDVTLQVLPLSTMIPR